MADRPLDEKINKQKETPDKSTPVQSSKTSQKEPQTMEELLSMTGEIALGVKKGSTVEGVVVSVTTREILIDIGKKSYGTISEWEMDQPNEYITSLKLGDRVVAQVMSPENDYGYVVLSLRRATSERRWTILTEAKEAGKNLEVQGLELAKGGLLVDWQGLRGFVPSTQLEGNLASNLSSLIGKRINVKVLEVDRAVNRLVLSQKAYALGTSPASQREKLDKIKSGDTLKGTVSGIASFGIFVDIDGMEGLVHISELAWEKVDHPSSLYKTGDKVEVLVLEVNKDEGKLNLSVKRLTPDPWKNILDRYPLESVVSGQVTRIAPYGVFVQIEPGIEGLLHISKLSSGEEPRVGEKIECMVEHIDPVRRKISLTLVPKEKPVGYR